MKALIIGGSGFVGGHLADHLENDLKWSVGVTKLDYERIANKNVKCYTLDILNKSEIRDVLFDFDPDCVFHLAAQSSVALSWKNPNLTVDININGVLNVLNVVHEMEVYPKILLIGSGEEYGNLRADEVPVKEGTLLRPGNIYAVTKVCQNMIGRIYSDAYNMNIMIVRAFNHIGPGQTPIFVVSDFCRQVAMIEKGLQEPVIYVGNLGAQRDFTDVRDVVKAYSLLMKKGIKGETYNVGSGKALEIHEILDRIISLSTKEISVKIDKDKFRPVDIPIIEADVTKLVNATNWKPQISLNKTLSDTLNFFRKTI